LKEEPLDELFGFSIVMIADKVENERRSSER
jgi:hypothetical protein